MPPARVVLLLGAVAPVALYFVSEVAAATALIALAIGLFLSVACSETD